MSLCHFVTVSLCHCVILLLCHCVMLLSLSTEQYCVIVCSHWSNILDVSLKFRASQSIRFKQIEWQCEHISTISIFPQYQYFHHFCLLLSNSSWYLIYSLNEGIMNRLLQGVVTVNFFAYLSPCPTSAFLISFTLCHLMLLQIQAYSARFGLHTVFKKLQL